VNHLATEVQNLLGFATKFVKIVYEAFELEAN